MQIQGLVWVGTRTERYAETVAFFRDRLGLRLGHEVAGFAILYLPDTSQVEVFDPGGPEPHDHFTTGPVAEFLVDDVAGAARELEDAGIETWGPYGGEDDPRHGWVHFRAPDGRIYGLTNGPQYRR